MAKPVGKDRSVLAVKLWNSSSGKAASAAFVDIKQALRAMAPGDNACMYCEDNEAYHIEHFRPKSLYPEAAFVWSNYLWACARCNSYFKGSQFPLDPLTRDPLLIDPTVDDPNDHLELSPSTGVLVALTPKGIESISVYGLHRFDGRRLDWWQRFTGLILAYGIHRTNGDGQAAQEIKDAILRSAHLSVLAAIIRCQDAAVLRPQVRAVILQRPEIGTWC